MNIPPGKQPASVQDYERGRAAEGAGSPASFGSRLLWSDSNAIQQNDSHSRGSSISPLGGDRRERLDVRRRRYGCFSGLDVN
jgi:hypothetical protein